MSNIWLLLRDDGSFKGLHAVIVVYWYSTHFLSNDFNFNNWATPPVQKNVLNAELCKKYSCLFLHITSLLSTFRSQVQHSVKSTEMYCQNNDVLSNQQPLLEAVNRLKEKMIFFRKAWQWDHNHLHHHCIRNNTELIFIRLVREVLPDLMI